MTLLRLNQCENERRNIITSVKEGEVFYVLGYYGETYYIPLPGRKIWVYITDSNGEPVTPFRYSTGVTDSNGFFRVRFVAKKVDGSDTLYFRAFDYEYGVTPTPRPTPTPTPRPTPTPTPVPTTGRKTKLIITSIPSGAEIYINGKYINKKTPAVVEID